MSSCEKQKDKWRICWHWRLRAFVRSVREWLSVIDTLRRVEIPHSLWLVRHFEYALGGSLSSRLHLPVRPDGSPLPWYPYAAIHFLEQFDLSNCVVFEYGSGNSSLFWAARARSVYSVEIDPAWHEQIRSQLLPNQYLSLETDAREYARKICDYPDKFDVIVIDGAVRRLCATYAVSKLTETGFIILENSDRYPETARFLRMLGFQQIDLIGPGPINSYTWSASIFSMHGISIPRKCDDGGVLVEGGLCQTSWDDSMEAIIARYQSQEPRVDG
jgi:hypothetical protein